MLSTPISPRHADQTALRRVSCHEHRPVNQSGNFHFNCPTPTTKAAADPAKNKPDMNSTPYGFRDHATNPAADNRTTPKSANRANGQIARLKCFAAIAKCHVLDR